jgi:pimeloyl-ACP methyl ester carboxylesterase
MAARRPQPPVLFVLGEDDDRALITATTELRDALKAAYALPEHVSLVTVPGLGHALAEEPGLEPALQSPGAARVDAEMTAWLSRHLQRS